MFFFCRVLPHGPPETEPSSETRLLLTIPPPSRLTAPYTTWDRSTVRRSLGPTVSSTGFNGRTLRGLGPRTSTTGINGTVYHKGRTLRKGTPTHRGRGKKESEGLDEGVFVLSSIGTTVSRTTVCGGNRAGPENVMLVRRQRHHLTTNRHRRWSPPKMG